MSDREQLTHAEKQALDELGSNFRSLLADEAEPAHRQRPRRLTVAVAGLALGATALAVWAVAWPGGSQLSVDDAFASIADVAAIQVAPKPDQYVYSESTVTALAKRVAGSTAPEGVRMRELYTVRVERKAWLSMARRGVIQAYMYSQGDNGISGKSTSGTTRALPNYRLADETFRPSEISAMAKQPGELTRTIDEAVLRAPEDERVTTKWRLLTEPLRDVAPPLPSVLRAELIRDLSTVPGVESVLKDSDPKGRVGESFAVASNGLNFRVVFDSRNAQLLYDETKIAEAGAGPYGNTKPGQTLASYLLVSSKVVEDAPRSPNRSAAE